MKNVLKIGFVAGLTFFSTLVFGKNTTDYIVSLDNATSSSINVEVPKAKNVSLYIYNGANIEIYSEKINSKDSFIKSYNFKNLPSGTYYLVAESNSKIEKYRIKIKKGEEISIDKTPVEELVKPDYTIDGNLVKLHMTDLKGKVKISVSDLSDNEYYNVVKKPIKGKLDLNFDLNPETSDTYVIRIEKNSGALKQTIIVK